MQEDGAAEEEDVDDEFDMEDDDYYQGENFGVPASRGGNACLPSPSVNATVGAAPVCFYMH